MGSNSGDIGGKAECGGRYLLSQRTAIDGHMQARAEPVHRWHRGNFSSHFLRRLLPTKTRPNQHTRYVQR